MSDACCFRKRGASSGQGVCTERWTSLFGAWRGLRLRRAWAFVAMFGRRLAGLFALPLFPLRAAQFVFFLLRTCCVGSLATHACVYAVDSRVMSFQHSNIVSLPESSASYPARR